MCLAQCSLRMLVCRGLVVCACGGYGTFTPMCAFFFVWHLQIHLVWDEPPTNLTYCAQVSVEEFERQRMTTSQQALNRLLEDIVNDKTMTDKDRKRRLKQVEHSTFRRHTDIESEMPFFLISQEFLIFTNLNSQWKTYNLNKKLERF